MIIDLNTALPSLLPKAITWAESIAIGVASNGKILSDEQQELARRVGVAQPEKIRLALVEALPIPTDPELRAAALQIGLFGGIGLTLDHSILIVKGRDTRTLLSHELRHVYQYEQAGSIAAFLPVYLKQIIKFGYMDSPLEMDARDFEI